MPVPLFYTVSLSPDRAPCAGKEPRIVIVPDHTGPSMVSVLVPIQYTPLHGHSEELDVSMVEAIVQGDTVCRYPVRESCLKAWLVQYLYMASTDAQNIVNTIRRKKEALSRKNYIEMFLRQELRAYDIMKRAHQTHQAYSVKQHCKRVAALRYIFWGLSFYGVRTIDAHLRLHPVEHVCDCVRTLHFLWQREYDTVDEDLFLVGAKTFCIKRVDNN